MVRPIPASTAEHTWAGDFEGVSKKSAAQACLACVHGSIGGEKQVKACLGMLLLLTSLYIA